MTSITGNSVLDKLAASSATETAAAKSKGSSTLDQTSFLKLMTTQLQTQDPFAPVDNTQMVAQMAQFSSVTGIAEMNTSLKSIQSDLQDQRVGGAAGWIGRSALISSDAVLPQADGSYNGQLGLDGDVASLKLSLVDADGQVVFNRDYGAQNAGALNFSWDGKASDTSLAASGPLTMRVSAKDADGGPVTASTASWALVTGIQSPAGGAAARLVTGLGLIAPTDAQRIA